jgi:Na+-driven multidrug efflux pump
VRHGGGPRRLGRGAQARLDRGGDGLTGLAGLSLALFPGPAARAFAADPGVIAALRSYLVIVGPCFGLFGVGMALYFASQGVARMRRPFLASLARCAIGAGGGALLARRFALEGAFAGVALGISAYGLIVASAVRKGVWGARG